MALQMWLLDDIDNALMGLEMIATALPDAEQRGFRLAMDATRQALGIEPRRPVAVDWPQPKAEQQRR